MATPRRRRVSLKLRRALVLTHRWIGLIGGLLVVIISTSGAILVYQPELVRALHPEIFRTTSATEPVGFARAITEVQSHYPEIQLGSASLKDGVYLLNASGTHDTFFVDAGTGLLNGRIDLGAGVLGFLVNMHDCGFTCEGYSGYLPILTQPSRWRSSTPSPECPGGPHYSPWRPLSCSSWWFPRRTSGGSRFVSYATPYVCDGPPDDSPVISTCTP
nr:PepSY-associated TM helix domain-containing protein [Mycobacteroides chelonae]